MLDEPKLTLPEGKHYRIIHSKYPPANIFSKTEIQNYAVGDIESVTSRRVLMTNMQTDQGYTETNQLLLKQDLYVDEADLRFGNGWGAVMASFAYPRKGRYSTDKQGAYYCADSIHAGLCEWAFHTQKYWVEEMHFDNEVSAVVRCYTGTFKFPLLDVRGRSDLTTDSYEANHRVLSGALIGNMHGILYDSARYDGGICAALLRPPATSEVIQAGHYALLFDGKAFTDYSKLGKLHTL